MRRRFFRSLSFIFFFCQLVLALVLACACYAIRYMSFITLYTFAGSFFKLRCAQRTLCTSSNIYRRQPFTPAHSTFQASLIYSNKWCIYGSDENLDEHTFCSLSILCSVGCTILLFFRFYQLLYPQSPHNTHRWSSSKTFSTVHVILCGKHIAFARFVAGVSSAVLLGNCELFTQTIFDRKR